jgi:hypothetical protein
MPTFRLTPVSGGVQTVVADDPPGPDWVEIATAAPDAAGITDQTPPGTDPADTDAVVEPVSEQTEPDSHERATEEPA